MGFDCPQYVRAVADVRNSKFAADSGRSLSSPQECGCGCCHADASAGKTQQKLLGPCDRRRIGVAHFAPDVHAGVLQVRGNCYDRRVSAGAVWLVVVRKIVGRSRTVGSAQLETVLSTVCTAEIFVLLSLICPIMAILAIV